MTACLCLISIFRSQAVHSKNKLHDSKCAVRLGVLVSGKVKGERGMGL